MNLFFSPKSEFSVANISLTETVPKGTFKWGSRHVYCAACIWGVVQTPTNFYIDIETPANYNGAVLDFAVVAQHFTANKDEFNILLNKFPPWTALAAGTSTYESWII